MVSLDEPVALLPDEIARALPAFVFFVDRHQRYRFVSRAFESRFGHAAEELRGRHVREVIGDQAYETVRPWIERALHGEAVRFPADVPGADGRLHTVEVRYSPHRDGAGQILGYYGLVLDVSETESQARRERERDQQLQMALEATGLGTWEYDAVRRVVTLSPRTAEIFGLSGAGDADWDFLGGCVHPDDRARRLAVAAEALRTGLAFDTEYRFRRPVDGREIWVHTRGQASRDASGATVGLIGVLSDITRTKTVETGLRDERQRLQDLERNQSFLLRLSDAIRESADPAAIIRTSIAMLGEHLGANRVGYAELDEAAEVLHIGPEWSDGKTPSIAGAYPLFHFGLSLSQFLRSGSTLVTQDSTLDHRLQSPQTQALFADFRARSHIGVPLLRGGRAVAMLFVHVREPREWTPSEVALVEAVASRTWADLGRARTERTLRESEERFRIMADTAPAPVWVTGAAGGIAFVNQAFADFAGRSREEMMGQGWISLVHPDDLPTIMAGRDQAVADRRNFSFEARFRRHDGAMHWMRCLCNARLDEQGRFLGFVGIAMDTTEIRKVEAALRESEERFRRIAEDAPIMMWICGPDGRTEYMNSMLRAFFGKTDAPEDALDWSDAVAPEDRESSYAQFAAALERQDSFWAESRFIRADGEVRDIFTRAAPRRDADGAFIGMIGVNVDVTDARRAELHQQLLINELNHRVKNTLASVQSIAHQTLRDGVMTREARQLLTSRLLALSAAHNVLTRENWERAELQEIAEEAVRAHQDAARPRIAVAGPPARLSPKQALAVSMALHELSTNATKYGALSAPGGRVTVDWALDAAGQMVLTWRETGGPPVKAPARRGFGSRLLHQGLSVELGAPAELVYAPEGLVCTIRASLNQ